MLFCSFFSRRLLLVPVKRRDAKTLIPIIQKFTAPGTVVFSDGWAAYLSTNDAGVEHFSVIHKDGFQETYKNTRTGEIRSVNTQKCGGAWSIARQHFYRMRGCHQSTFVGWTKQHDISRPERNRKTSISIASP